MEEGLGWHTSFILPLFQCQVSGDRGMPPDYSSSGSVPSSCPSKALGEVACGGWGNTERKSRKMASQGCPQGARECPRLPTVSQKAEATALVEGILPRGHAVLTHCPPCLYWHLIMI